jgi:Spy/CpxP family protein refolding chaperone
MAGTTNPRADIEALVAGPKFERERAQSLVEAKTAAVRSKSPEVIAAAADFYDNLRPEQQLKVREFLAKRHGWRS